MSNKNSISPESLKSAAGGYEAPEVETPDKDTGEQGIISVVLAPSVATNTMPNTVVQVNMVYVTVAAGEKKD